MQSKQSFLSRRIKFILKNMGCNKGFVLLEYVISLAIAAVAISFIFFIGQGIRQKITSSYGVNATIQSIDWKKNGHNFDDFFKPNGQDQWDWTIGNAHLDVSIKDEKISISSKNDGGKKLLKPIYTKLTSEQVSAVLENDIITIG